MHLPSLPSISTLVICALVLFSDANANGACQETRVRREWRELSRDQQHRYLKAVRATQRRSDDKPSRYDLLAKMHGDAAMPLHVHPVFLPWHRAFIFWFENGLRKLDSSITLPFWDWSHDASEPQDAPVFGSSPLQFGTNGVGEEHCVKDGAFKDWHPLYPEEHCLKRIYRNQVRRTGMKPDQVKRTISALVSSETMNMFLSKSNTFGEVAKAIELTPHGTVHNNLGGDMLSMYSPNDPVFFLHHTNIDRLWDAWQRLSPSKNVYAYGGKNHNGSPAKLSDRLHNKVSAGAHSREFAKAMFVGDVMNNSRFLGRLKSGTKTFCILYKPLKGNVLPPLRVSGGPPASRPSVSEKEEEEEEEEEKPRRRRPPPTPKRRPPPREEVEEEEEEEESPRHRPPPQEEEEEESEETEEEESEETERRLVALLRRELAKTTPTTGISDGTAVRPAEPMSPVWMAMNGIKESDMLTMSVIEKKMLDELNKLYTQYNYIPESSELGNRDTFLSEVKKKSIFAAVGRKGQVKCTTKKNKTPEQNWEHCKKFLTSKGFIYKMTDALAKKYVKITGKPAPGVAPAAVNKVVKQVAPAIKATKESLTQAVNKVAPKDLKKAGDKAKSAESKAPSQPLDVKGAAGKDGKGNTNAKTEAKIQKKSANAKPGPSKPGK